MNTWVLRFSQINNGMIAQVGGKNASLGELFNGLRFYGVRIPDGFALTTEAYLEFIRYNQLKEPIQQLINELDIQGFTNLATIGSQIRVLIQQATLPPNIAEAVKKAFDGLKRHYQETIQVAVRSSATAEDLVNASFAGQHESFLNIKTEEQLLTACQACYASLFTDRAIKYRQDNGFDHLKVALSVGVQKMVRSDQASSGVCFTVDPDTGHANLMLITGSWGLGENVVLGNVNPDEFYVFKPSINRIPNAIVNQKLGDKSVTMVYADSTEATKQTVNIETPQERREQPVLTHSEVNQLASWALLIEQHYGKPMDIEWAKDYIDQQLYIVQARPITSIGAAAPQLTEYHLQAPAKALTQGQGIGQRIVTGTARVVASPKDVPASICSTDILVTDITTPDWDPILKKVSAIITNRGGRTSHAAIVAREVGALAVVGTNNGSEVIPDGATITVSCLDAQEGFVYEGAIPFTQEIINLIDLPKPRTKCMLILGDPSQALRLAQLPSDGVGLMRLEFIIANAIGIHPMALARFDQVTDDAVKNEINRLTRHYQDKKEFFVDKLAQSVALVAASFYPRPVIVRMSDFKTNEYANLLGGCDFEPLEENPMLGWRGASRYYDPRYMDGFRLECEAMRRVRDKMGFVNVKLMIPFCRTVEEGKRVLAVMDTFGLTRQENGLEVYVMAEIPSNIMQAEAFAELFDGFSIGSNDLTQLALGVDRDSSTVQGLFNENDPTVRDLIAMLIKKARHANRPVGICGQGPSDNPDFAQFLTEEGINSLSLTPDAFLRGLTTIHDAETRLILNSV
ncbi:phosphoenolpyruvate synthase [Spirosoma sp. KCTC 42546]|uniref:phosphoenolpyruvate synthase n=1 Tax=Spirosoma sp. KCTC 42546 TaxID=2520506 RepID=UPI0011595B32|nr:phosphoenolpyruvate synthase [Spirosoma sp. KCTC 42546]QDK77497.1 phosphoenolpyruvate synthase [Spirosoma sp. KCTC 42546]